MTRFFASVFFFLAITPYLAPQNDPRQNCELSVRVVTSDERRVEGQVQVQLLTPQGVASTVHVTGGDAALFYVANAKTYRLTVSGAGLETVTTPFFEINALEQNHTEIVHVKPDKKNQAAEAQGSSTVSVSELNIPRKAASEMNKGMEEYSKGDFDKAATHFEKALAEYSSFARAYDMLGAIAIKHADRPRARDLFAKSIQVDVTFLPAYLDLARMNLQDERYAESESLLTRAIALDPTRPDTLALFATTEFANKDYSRALVYAERTHAVRNHEPFAEVHLMAGKVLRMQNHPDQAIVQFQLFLKEKPDSPQAETARQALASLQTGQPH